MNILITGTSTGIGAALAQHYLQLGHQVFGISRKKNITLAEYGAYSHQKLDLTRFSRVRKRFSSFLSPVEKLDLVILNAGILNEIKDLKDTSIEEIEEVMDINVWANKNLIDALYKLKKPVTQVAAISSGAAVSGSRGWNAYSISKAALNMIVSLYSKEHTNTHFIALAPGLIDTNMQEYICNLPDSDKYPAVRILKEARGTDKMPTPIEAAPLIANAIEQSKAYESGSFVDIRKME
ncbi:MAG TPA: alcohol dehydrogenase [Bacteroidales bacterium]|jgi:benzil reductase ((S)-benzoin forming)|nr:alcohol dehydrogenase [Bacteroidales bacterium]